MERARLIVAASVPRPRRVHPSLSPTVPLPPGQTTLPGVLTHKRTSLLPSYYPSLIMLLTTISCQFLWSHTCCSMWAYNRQGLIVRITQAMQFGTANYL